MIPNRYLVMALYKIVARRFDRYMQMFNKIITANPEAKEKIQKQIKYAIDTFKREDRIMWYLKKYRLRYTEPDNAEAKNISQHFGDLKHFLSNAEINNFRTVLDYEFKPDASVKQVVDDLKGLEELENKKREEDTRLIDHAEYGEGDLKPIIEFDDGWAWFLIDQEYCELEGDAMRHCGNKAEPKEGDQVLSLREPKQEGKNTYYKPHATFILNNGFLGEMKGYANEKPKKSLHPYIKELLLSDYVEMILGGGYEAQKNFDLTDMSDEDQKEILAKKPELGVGMSDYYKKKGLTEGIKKYLNTFFEYNGDFEHYKHNNKDYLVISYFDNFEEYADYYDSELSRALKVMEDAYESIYIDSFNKDEIKETYEVFEKEYPELVEKIKNIIGTEYDDHDEPWEYDEVESAIESGLWDAHVADYESLMWKNIEDYKKYLQLEDGTKLTLIFNESQMDNPVRLVIEIGDFFDISNQIYQNDMVQHVKDYADKFQFPNWDGIGNGLEYEEAYKIAAERAHEKLLDEYPELEKKIAASHS